MNHLKKGAKVALVGENYFPPMSKSHTSMRRGRGLERIMSAIVHYQPSVMYVCPTKGVNINLLPFLILNNIPIRLVLPSKHFCATLTRDEKDILDLATSHADKIIILSSKKASPLDFNAHWFQATSRVIESSDWVMVAHQKEGDDRGFEELLNKFDKNPKPVLAVDFGEED
tara:strand:- start:160 stop:672 length:513 start_codon:yes stop_codon:yes gene_type:complete